jgi:hypothetical protein
MQEQRTESVYVTKGERLHVERFAIVVLDDAFGREHIERFEYATRESFFRARIRTRSSHSPPRCCI